MTRIEEAKPPPMPPPGAMVSGDEPNIVGENSQPQQQPQSTGGRAPGSLISELLSKSSGVANAAETGSKVLEAATAPVTSDTPAGLAAIRTETAGSFGKFARAASWIGTGADFVSRVLHPRRGLEIAKFTVGKPVEWIVSGAGRSAIQAAKAGGRWVLAGANVVKASAAGMIAGSGVENIAQGVADTDSKIWGDRKSLNEMYRANSRLGVETYRGLRAEGRWVPTALVVGMWRGIGADLKATAYYVRDQFGGADR